MPFLSVLFLFLFLPVTVVLHFFAARFGERERLCALILSSFSFVAAWDLPAAGLLGCSIAVNYGIAQLLKRVNGREQAFQPNLFLITGVAFNLGMLIVFRYGNFLMGSADHIFGTSFAVEKILVPLGVLFFSCDQIAYLADIRRGKRYEANFLRYAAFASFFPRLIAGPLLRYEHIEPQLAQHRPDAEDIAIGLTTFVIGLTKTVLLAGAVAPFATVVFSAAASGQPVEFFTAWTGVLAFTCQIYFDLSGYADMAIGLGRCFGIDLPVNFRSPYRAANIADFWLRWNITLTDFLRDYVYLPLGGNRLGTPRAMLNLVAAMILGGLWYGVGHMFLAWALLHAFYIVFHRVWRALWARNRAMSRFRETGTALAIRITITFIAVTLGWVIFRSADSATALDLFGAMSGLFGATLPAGFASLFGPILPLVQGIGIAFAPADSWPLLRAWLSIVFCLSVIFALPNTETLLSAWPTISTDDDIEPEDRLPLRWLPSPFWSMTTGALAFACLVSLGSAASYLHWRF